MLTDDKKFIKFDAAGNQQAKKFIAGLTKKSDIKVAVTGNVDGDQIAVSKIELQKGMAIVRRSGPGTFFNYRS